MRARAAARVSSVLCFAAGGVILSSLDGDLSRRIAGVVLALVCFAQAMAGWRGWRWAPFLGRALGGGFAISALVQGVSGERGVGATLLLGAFGLTLLILSRPILRDGENRSGIEPG